MRSTLEAIRAHPTLNLQLVVTGMHLDRTHGRSLDVIRREGWHVDARVPWRRGTGAGDTAAHTGLAMAGLARTFDRLRPDIVLVAGDRVEAFAAAAAAHVGGRILAHVHGGDRALGQVDDALRHAVTKLAHMHFPATRQSARRIERLGEDAWRIHRVGSPGVDGLRATAAGWDEVAAAFPGLRRRRFAVLVLHPTDADERAEERRAKTVLRTTAAAGFDQVVIVYPNNDPGAGGILRCWDALPAAAGGGARFFPRRDIPRRLFLGLMREAAAMVGNSSSGIIEAASFGTPVIDVGPRQLGRERSGNVTSVPFTGPAIVRALAHVWNDGTPIRRRARNVYGGDGAGAAIARVLGRVRVDDRLRRKLIRY